MKNCKYGDYYTVYENGDVINNKGKKLSFCDNGKGYLICSLYINGKRSTKALHRILAECFIPNPNNFTDVDHIDGDRRNNSLNNLRWLTHGDNIKHSYNLENRSAVGVNNARCLISEDVVHEICRLLVAGFGCAKIRDLYGYSYASIRAIKIRKNWKHISCNYKW
jgi:hypothetical protein